ncbi:MAG: winged helix-turn-helix transcriptional regulator, partial [Nitrososphaerota archaeon]
KKFTLCPLGGSGVGGTFKFRIMYHLLDGTKRMGELQRLIPGASRQMLTIQLRELEEIRVIRRKVYAQLPPKVEYSLTDAGRQSAPLLRQFYFWGQWCAGAMGLEYDDWLMLLSSRWMFWIWYHLGTGAKRFRDLEQLLPQANHQILAARLHKLEEMGVICRDASAEEALRAGYTLTEMGQKSMPMMRVVYEWGRWYCAQIGLQFQWPLNNEPEGDVHSLADLTASAAAWSAAARPGELIA